MGRARRRNGAVAVSARRGLASLCAWSGVHSRLLQAVASDRSLPGAATACEVVREGDAGASDPDCKTCLAQRAMTIALSLFTVVGAILIVSAWVLMRRRRLERREQSWLPEELKSARLELAERVFHSKWPFRLYAKIDRAYKGADGVLVLTELKRRFHREAYRSDVVELSAQKLA